MTREETIKILAILKAAYPNSYKNMSKEEANGTVTVWAMQFSNYPAEVVMIAVNKLIASSVFPPTICDVKKKVDSLYWELWEGLEMHKRMNNLSENQEKYYRKLLNAVEPIRSRLSTEPSLFELTSGSYTYLLGDGEKEGTK